MKRLSRLCALVLAALAACQSPSGAHAAPLPENDAPAEQPAAAEPSPPPAVRIATPALWKVADEDTTIYIFGTVHVLPKGIDWFNGKVEKAFDSSQQLVTEIPVGDPLDMQALVMDKAMLKDGKTLRALLSDKLRAKYENALKSLGVPLGTFDRFEPWYATIGLSTLPLMQEGFATENGVEKFLHARASERGMAEAGLETAAYQLSLFDTLPIKVQKNYLGEVIAQLPDVRTDLKAMITAWETGDARELARLMNAEETDPVLIQRLLINRNKAWAHWIEERLEQPGTVFLAVGAGHLAGKGSLQEQLAADGIASERIQ